jgi:hypothetical protein
MRQLLIDLVGSTISTMTGKENHILKVSGGIVWVATSRSPEGKPVEIRQVQAAVDRLYRNGELEISVQSVGYRSAFVGAVLSTLPGTVVMTRPRRIRLLASGSDWGALQG